VSVINPKAIKVGGAVRQIQAAKKAQIVCFAESTRVLSRVYHNFETIVALAINRFSVTGEGLPLASDFARCFGFSSNDTLSGVQGTSGFRVQVEG
jgi:hypothetical protein